MPLIEAQSNARGCVQAWVVSLEALNKICISSQVEKILRDQHGYQEPKKVAQKRSRVSWFWAWVVWLHTGADQSVIKMRVRVFLL
jgi:hypothetical protein